MAKVSVYLPDELEQRARELPNRSAICQQAIELELAARDQNAGAALMGIAIQLRLVAGTLEDIAK